MVSPTYHASPGDALRIAAARGLRSFAYGLLAVVLGVWLARSAGASLSPVVAGLLLQPALLALGLPFIVAGILKVGQNLGLWLVFRHVRLPAEEAPRVA